jgi:hypothetical protein
MKPRNIFAMLASKRKAGSHRKSNKAVRRDEKVKDKYVQSDMEKREPRI